MVNEQAIDVREGDILSVSKKLEQFCNELPASEQVVMGWLLQRAADAEEVRGYDATPVRQSQMRAAILEGLGLSIPR
ncbi:MAG: hypothetical protein ACR2PL_10270 [Dehalococcoidia bacterium]